MAGHSFCDDYSEGAHPSILEALAETNLVQQEAYGRDEYSNEARELIRAHLGGSDADIWFVASGTLANTLGISSALRPHEAVIAATSGHIAGPETGAIEATGHKVIAVPPERGKLTPAIIEAALEANSLFPHMAKPRMVYISNATEVGTLYTKAEFTAIAKLCRSRDLLLMVDGARMGAAMTAAGNDMALAGIAELADIFWIGGTKAGALIGEAVVIPNKDLRPDFEFMIKQRGTLLSKGRILGLQFRELFRDRLFFELSAHANAMAAMLAAGLAANGVELWSEPETNQVFPILADDRIRSLREKFDFHDWERADRDRDDKERSVIRLVASWATPEKAVEGFLKAL